MSRFSCAAYYSDCSKPFAVGGKCLDMFSTLFLSCAHSHEPSGEKETMPIRFRGVAMRTSLS